MAPQKKINRQLTLELDAGNAAMVDIGKMLGPTGVNTRQLKLDYDAATAAQRGEIVPVVVTVFDDRSYALRLKTPPTAYLIRKALGLAGGSGRPGSQTVAKISRQQLREIAERKLPDLNTEDVAAAMRQVAGTARSMGVLVADD
ncbi:MULTISPECIES: uL11 family ribosomal protein [unclassified Plantactinospora]|uniref:uL11 family ribosomal protein n=1 Tax=unclassified Plantactinospora TaxID=2631981 RepID=UPI000D151890|nr:MULTISPECIES: 50S ribosomal protein L11 [unclassified Plantactinospora]AVT33362.1 50S ribosomal protein L11 [Plantactinospora sp. BC1]AVT40148.1 50S ribosomal protein L11 [Plantactinospora sp. BB1]